MHNFIKIGLLAAKLWPKNDFLNSGRPPLWIVKIFVFGHVTVTGSQIHFCIKFHQNRMIFSLRYGDLTIVKMVVVRRLEFSKFRVYVTWPLSPCYSTSLCISLKSENRLLSYDDQQEVKVIWQKAPHGGPIPRLGVTPGGRKLYHWIPGVGFPISVP